jgi:hypothetical protein
VEAVDLDGGSLFGRLGSAVHKYMAAHPEEYIDATFKNGWGFDASYGENNLAEYMEGGGSAHRWRA